MSVTTVAGSFITLNTIDSDHYVDGSIDLVHIGANQIDGTKIAVGSDARGDVLVYDGTNYVRLGADNGKFLRSNGTGSNPSWETAGGGDLSFGGDTFTEDKVIGSNDAFALSFETGGVVQMKIWGQVTNPTSAGAITMPNTPCVMVYNSVADTGVTGASAQIIIDLNQERFDQGGDFTNDRFTAPVTGRYLLNAHLTFQSITAAATGCQAIFTTTLGQHTMQVGGGALRCANNQIGISIGIISDMDAGDTVTLQGSVVGESSNTVVAVRGGNTATVFSVMLLA